MRYLCLALTALITVSGSVGADAIRQTKGDFRDAFRQLDVDLPTPNTYRTASGAPGSQYWQQRADYKIKVRLDETSRRISASETITYTNHSPDTLRYIWLQLDQNRFTENSLERLSETAKDAVGRKAWTDQDKDVLSYSSIARRQLAKDIDYGFEIERVVDAREKDLPHTITGTMMRIDLPQSLAPGQATTFSIDWSFNILLEERADSRGGYEHFRDNDTYIYFLAQWFPRLAAYTDYTGWQHKAFIGWGEFTLEFGNYEVEITVPDDHIVSATGKLQNPGKETMFVTSPGPARASSFGMRWSTNRMIRKTLKSSPCLFIHRKLNPCGPNTQRTPLFTPWQSTRASRSPFLTRLLSRSIPGSTVAWSIR